MPLIPAIPSRRPQSFYRCLLAGIPAEPNLGNKAYLALLKARRGGHAALEDAAADDDIDGIIVPGLMPPPMPLPAPEPVPDAEDWRRRRGFGRDIGAAAPPPLQPPLAVPEAPVPVAGVLPGHHPCSLNLVSVWGRGGWGVPLPLKGLN